MADIQALKAEIDTDPLGRGYAGMTDSQAADDINTVYRTRNKTSLSGDEIFNAANGGELAALASGAAGNQRKFQMFLALCSRDSINPFGSANVALVQEVFGAGSASLAALNALRTEQVSRAVELELGEVTAGLVAHVRTL